MHHDRAERCPRADVNDDGVRAVSNGLLSAKMVASICRAPTEHIWGCCKTACKYCTRVHLSNTYRISVGLQHCPQISDSCPSVEHLSNICRAARVPDLHNNTTPLVQTHSSFCPSVEHLLPANIGSRELLSAKIVASICRPTSFGLQHCPGCNTASKSQTGICPRDARLPAHIVHLTPVAILAAAIRNSYGCCQYLSNSLLQSWTTTSFSQLLKLHYIRNVAIAPPTRKSQA